MSRLQAERFRERHRPHRMIKGFFPRSCAGRPDRAGNGVPGSAAEGIRSDSARRNEGAHFSWETDSWKMALQQRRRR